MRQRFVYYLSAFVFALLIGTESKASSINWLYVNNNADWEKVITQAKEKKQKLFLDFTTSWCGYCKLMDKDVFSQAEVAEALNKNFISVKVDGDSLTGKTLGNKYGVEGYPTFVVLSHSESVLMNVSGYMEASVLLESCEKAIQKEALAAQFSAYKSIEDVPENKKKEYILYTYDTNPEQAEKWAESILLDFTGEDFLNKENAAFITTFTQSIDGRAFKYLSENKQAFIEAQGQQTFEEVISNIFNNNLANAIKTRNEELLSKIISNILPIYLPSEDQLPEATFTVQKLYYINTDETEKYEKATETYHIAYAKSDSTFWLVQAYEIVNSDSATDPFLKLASKFIKKSIAIKPTMQAYYLYGVIEVSSANFEEGIKLLEKALELASTPKEQEEIKEMIRVSKGAMNNELSEDF